MSTDRELLEAAAKAAGIEIDCWLDEDPRAVTSEGLWNPLTDDGDALRLAVKLRLKIEVKTNHVYVIDDESGLVIAEDYIDDPLAATRLAIVRAAAEIGRSKE